MEQENVTWTDVESENMELENEEDQCIYPEDMELESSESQRRGHGNLEHLGSAMNNLELKGNWAYPSEPAGKLADRPPIDPKSGPVEQEMEEHTLVETREEKDWVEEYKERRIKFLGGGCNGGLKKLDVWGRIQRELTNNQEETNKARNGLSHHLHHLSAVMKIKRTKKTGSEQEMQTYETLTNMQTWIQSPNMHLIFATPNRNPTLPKLIQTSLVLKTSVALIQNLIEPPFYANLIQALTPALLQQCLFSP